MATAALYPPSIMQRIWREADEPKSQGWEGQQVERAYLEAACHCRLRPSCDISIATADDEFRYDPVPLTIIGTVRVKYTFIGRIKPSPYYEE